MPRKPTIRGRNRLRNLPKAFRSSDKTGMNHLICCRDKTAFRLGDMLVHSGKTGKATANSEGNVTFNGETVA